ncbi:MAG TPA: ABC transporter permease [Solirubrobacteraceae bacterium]|nr:ABC transporter permease [Solirubrobacteraceae bacterium]
MRGGWLVRIIGIRILTAIPLVLLVSFIIFALESFVPGNPAETILGQNATPQNVAALDHQLGLNRSFLVGFWTWLTGVVHGNLGTSILSGESVSSLLDGRLGVTLSLVICSVLVSAVVGVGLGLLSAYRGGWLGTALDVVSLAGLALPTFLVGTVLVVLLAVRAKVFPATGYVTLAQSPVAWFEHLVLPVCSLSLLGVASVAKQARDSILEALEADYIAMLRGNGMSEREILAKHVLRNAAMPVITVLGLVAIGTLGGTVFIESVFVLPGLGSLATQSTVDHDLPVILGVGLYFTVLVVCINLLVDIGYGLLNPRVKTR